MGDKLRCEECGEEIIDCWGIATVMKSKTEYHYFCSEEHGNSWAEKQAHKLICSEVLDA